jgi:hypothetical protein
VAICLAWFFKIESVDPCEKSCGTSSKIGVIFFFTTESSLHNASGKSALAEAIAYGAGSKDESEDAFLNKAARHAEAITGTKIELVWANGSKTEFTVGTNFQDKGLVRHLPQGVVEELCSHKNSEKLQNQIENVIFQALDETAKLGASDFDELKSTILRGFAYEKQERQGKILNVNKRLDELYSVLKSLPEKERLLAEKNKELVLLIKSLPELPPEDRGIDEKQKATRAFETTKIKYQEQKKIILSLQNSIQALETEISKIRAESAPEITRLEKERVTIYCSYFNILNEEKLRIESLYKPIQDTLLAGSETDKKLVFEARIQYAIENHFRAGLEIIDRTRKGNFREMNSLKDALFAMWDGCAKAKFSEQALETELNKIIKNFQTFDGNTILLEDQLRDGCSVGVFYNWLFDPSNFSIVSSLKFDGTDLYMLSPGQKGIILLMLYLEIDKGDYRPLIIDQPEENLDNLSVYKDLIRYFRERKQYRQIIMVTLNPIDEMCRCHTIFISLLLVYTTAQTLTPTPLLFLATNSCQREDVLQQLPARCWLLEHFYHRRRAKR